MMSRQKGFACPNLRYLTTNVPIPNYGAPDPIRATPTGS